MNKENRSNAPGILPVPRTKEETRRFYDCVSTSMVYNCLTAAFERKYAEMGLERLFIGISHNYLTVGYGKVNRVRLAVG